jgi:CheY-like chemotaxis protein
VGTLAGALEQLSTVTFDCMVMDLSLPDGSGYDLLEHMAGNDDVGFPPVIVYTGRALGREEEQRLRRYSKSIIIKGAFARAPAGRGHPVPAQRRGQPADRPAAPAARGAVATPCSMAAPCCWSRTMRNIFALSSVLEPLGVTLEIARNGRKRWIAWPSARSTWC